MMGLFQRSRREPSTPDRGLEVIAVQQETLRLATAIREEVERLAVVLEDQGVMIENDKDEDHDRELP